MYICIYINTHTHTHINRSNKATQDRVIVLGSIKVLEAFAYYAGTSTEADGVEADHGTVLRFVERYGSFSAAPGMYMRVFMYVCICVMYACIYV